MRLRVRAMFLAFACARSAPAMAQSRELHWRAIDVTARLDSSGQLHVRERQDMIFTGDWNGGERRFNIRVGQKLIFQRLLRVDSTTGREEEMPKGSLDVIDNYDWGSNRVLRWRSRQPSDRLFLDTPLTYILEYTLSNILVPRGEGYVLDHDFAFADRGGDIEHFTLQLTLDSAWHAPPGFTGSYGPVRLTPGNGYVVTAPLAYGGVGTPAGLLSASAPLRYALGAILILTLIALGQRVVTTERATGRFGPLVPVEAINDAWLAEHLLSMLPEVAGAAWDDSTGAAEVAAVLARMEAEKKVRSRVETKKTWMSSSHELHMSLLVQRSQLSDYELGLVNALFMPGSSQTSTREVRARYAKSGFDPAGTIRKPLEELVRRLGPRSSEFIRPSRWPSVMLFMTGVALMARAGMLNASDAIVAAVGGAFSLPFYGFAAVQAILWRNRVQAWMAHSFRYLLPMSVPTVALLILLYTGAFRLGGLALAGLTALCLAFWNSVLNLARARQAPSLLALRKRLASARAYLQEQLRREQPALRDEWVPYLLAFGLGPQMDKWFRAFAGASSGISHGAVAQSSGGGWSGARSEGSWTGFGGGGGFSGGGSSGSWAAAVGTMAAGVAAPSSSGSSGGGSSGGGSSGGGGGGGW